MASVSAASSATIAGARRRLPRRLPARRRSPRERRPGRRTRCPGTNVASRASRVLPAPPGPVSVTRRAVRRSVRTRSTSAARPTKLDSPAVRGATSAGRSTDIRASASSGPGSTPSSSARSAIAASSAASASAWRPAACRARPSSAAVVSRSGAAASWAVSASTSGARPSRNASRACSSTTSARRASSRAAAGRAKGSSATSDSAGPRHSANASPSRLCACAGRRRPGLGDQRFERHRVHRARVDGQPVATRLRDHQLARQHAPQARDQRLQRVGCVLRRDLPEAVDERGGADGPPGVQREPGQQPTQADTGQAARPVDGAQHADPHGHQCDGRPSLVDHWRWTS